MDEQAKAERRRKNAEEFAAWVMNTRGISVEEHINRRARDAAMTAEMDAEDGDEGEDEDEG